MRSERLHDFEVLLGGKTPLQAHRIDRFDVIRTATERDSMTRLLYVLSRQAGIYYGWDQPGFYQKGVSKRAYLEALSILFGKSELPYPVGICTQAVLKFGISPNVDCTAFRDNVIVRKADNWELDQCYNKWDEADRISDGILRKPALLAGSVLQVYWDGVGENTVQMRRVVEGIYERRWTVGGGHADRYSEATGLEEILEEAGLVAQILHRAEPLGVADQVVAVQIMSGRPHLVHYVNYMWAINLKHDERAIDVEPGRIWQTVDDNDLVWMKEDKMFTPIAECALEAVGLI